MKSNMGRAVLLWVVGLTACMTGTAQPLRQDTIGTTGATPPPTTGGGNGTTGTAGGTTAGTNPNDGNQTMGTTTGAPGTGAGYTVIGRTLPMGGSTDPNHFRFSYEGVSIGVHFTGNDVSANLAEIPETFLGHTGDSYYDVMVDGNITSSFHTTQAMQAYPLAQNVTAGEHTVWLIKRTEGMIGSAEFNGLVVGTGTQLMTPPAPPAHRIEVLGASADTGYGDLGVNCSGYSADQQSSNEAWPQLTANLLGAELHNEAFSGKGLAINYDPINDPTLTEPLIFQRADCNDPTMWNFSNWIADVVVLDLGGNDYTGGGGTFDAASYETAYVTFVQQILMYYPKAYVYITVNPTDSGAERDALVAADQSVVMTLNGMGQANVKFLAFPAYTGNTWGCDNHPSPQLHQQTATQLAQQIKTDLKW